jgi:hypothetical protein
MCILLFINLKTYDARYVEPVFIFHFSMVDFIVGSIGVGALLLKDAMQFGKKVKVSFAQRHVHQG